jgi:microcystin-dependent protein
MALETATYINGLVPANPLGSDAIAFADDHIRLIKSTIKATFPNITGPVTLNQAQINSAMPMGGIIMWNGATIPAGWALCNGQTVARTDGGGNITTPDLRDRFIVAAGNGYGPNDVGGLAVYSLTTAQMPVHSHTATIAGGGDHIHGGSTTAVGDHTHNLQNLGSVQAGGDNGGASVSVSTGYSSGRFQAPTAAAGAHSHSFQTDPNGHHSHSLTIDNSGSGALIENRPPYYALYFIMKV